MDTQISVKGTTWGDVSSTGNDSIGGRVSGYYEAFGSEPDVTELQYLHMFKGASRTEADWSFVHDHRSTNGAGEDDDEHNDAERRISRDPLEEGDKADPFAGGQTDEETRREIEEFALPRMPTYLEQSIPGEEANPASGPEEPLQAAHIAEFNRLVDSQRKIRADYMRSIWRRPHEQSAEGTTDVQYVEYDKRSNNEEDNNEDGYMTHATEASQRAHNSHDYEGQQEMASTNSRAAQYLDASAGREVVYCHQCENEWYRDEHGLPCPRCHSEATEIVCLQTTVA